ncbi:MAG: class I SAM-dependent methyltransferase [Sedimentisphaerales bacterium]|nr:class I SAM-dependent methyltransferase [Sedimentisphaerales bacterium]
MKQSDNTTPYKANDYDKNVRLTIPFYELFHNETIDLVKSLKPDAKTWLDTGCGTGYMAGEAIQHFPETTFILSDPAEAMLINAKNRFLKYSSGNVRFLDSVPSDNLCSKLDTKPDVITAIMCHHYLKAENRLNATAACFDLLAPKGLYITFENIRPLNEESVQSSLERWGRFQLSNGRSHVIVEEHLKRFDKAYFPITVREHLALLKECGFRIIELFWFSQMQAGFYAIK